MQQKPTYYVVKSGNRFDLRQTRYAETLRAGNEHPNDLMATGFTAEGMQEIITKWFSDTDTDALRQRVAP